VNVKFDTFEAAKLGVALRRLSGEKSVMEFPLLKDADFTRFLALIYRVSGIRIPPTKRVLVSNRLRRRLQATGIADYTAYYEFLTSPAGAKEMPRFLDEITTNETYFFRDQHQFAWFGDEFLPEMIKEQQDNKRSKRLRIWSAAASSGAELYSIALLIAERRAALAGWNVSLLGTDLSESILQEARQAQFDARVVRFVDPKRLRAFFEAEPDPPRWKVKPEIRAMAKWQVHNLMKSASGIGPFDCIFLKNVLIYFDAESKQVVAKNVIDALAPGGYLVLGPTEMIPHMLSPLVRSKTWLYRKPA
jgi:chemotaxis protein methyltransferase CheR